MKYRIAVYVLTFLLLGGIASAQPSGTSESAAMQQLLAEVRQLRIAMEKMAIVAPRIQMTVQRMQMQEQRVARISQQLDDARKQIEGQTRNQVHAAEGAADIEERMSRETDPARRKQLEYEQGMIKRMLADQTTVQQMRVRESELAISLQNEQAVLNELNEKLNAIDRLLEPVPTAKQENQ